MREKQRSKYGVKKVAAPAAGAAVASGESVAKDHENTLLMVNKATLLGASTTPGGVEEVSLNYTRSGRVCVCVCGCAYVCAYGDAHRVWLLFSTPSIFPVSISVVPRCHCVELVGTQKMSPVLASCSGCVHLTVLALSNETYSNCKSLHLQKLLPGTSTLFMFHTCSTSRFLLNHQKGSGA